MFYLRTKWTKDTAVEKPKMNMCCFLGMRKYISFFHLSISLACVELR